MRRFLISCTAIAAVSLLLCQPLAAQDTKDKDKDKDKSKMNDNEEIIIKRKGDKDTKVTIEIKGDEVTVNGKPLEDFDDDNLVIKKGRTLYYGGHSPFTGGNAFSFDSRGNDNAPFLGVAMDKAEKAGAEIEEVTENSAADKAGLKENDIITKIDDETIATPDDVTRIVRKHKPDDKIEITYDRKGKTEKTTVTLGKKSRRTLTFTSPNPMPMPNLNFDWEDHGNFNHNFNFNYNGKPRLGIKAQDTEDGKGVKVLDVDNESAAEKAGIKKDDVITEFDGKKVSSTEDLVNASHESREKPAVKVTFNRNGKSQSVEIKTPKKLKTADL
ncbi:MAG: PDZ domain-containing protein [Niastella sp.]|jgi:serine protease Do|uniref:PDZ domain-containing protein n=1 Tax=Niastella sp. TaxID=1869183 RepID=UPI003899A74D